MAKLAHFKDIMRRFSGVADFLMIYIMEAHPTDGFAYSRNNFSIRNHRNLEERIKAGEMLQEQNLACDVVVDDISNNTNRAYAGLYERLYIMQNSKIVYAGELGPMGYSLGEVEEWLEKNTL